MGSEQKNTSPEKSETEAKLHNSFKLTVQPEAQADLDKWKMEFKEDQIYINGAPSGTEFFEVNELQVKKEGSVLAVYENSKSGEVFRYSGNSPEELIDSMRYIGILYMEAHPETMPSDPTYLGKMRKEKADLQAKHPNYINMKLDASPPK